MSRGHRRTPLRMAGAGLLIAGGLGLAAPASATHCDPVTVTVSDPVVSEGDSGTRNATFTVTKTEGCEVQLEWATSNGTAFASSGDYFPDTGQLTFGDGAGSQTVSIAVVGDRTREPDEQFHLDLTTLSSSHVVFEPDNRGTATITNDDPVPAISIGDTQVVEGDDDTRDAVFTLRLSNASSVPITVDFTTADGTAVVGDYHSGYGRAAFNPGETSYTVGVPVVGDHDDEGDETFFLRLSNPSNATIADGDAVAVIVDDESGGGTGDGHGYRMVAADGGIFTFGDRTFHGSTGDLRLAKPIVGGATDGSDLQGYWMVASDGGVFAFDAGFFGSLGSTQISAPAVEIEPTPTGDGYWIVLADGTVYPFGDAEDFGDFSGRPLAAPIIGMAITPTGGGYWLVAEDGGIFAFGDAGFFGSTGGTRINAPVVDLAPTPDGTGYHLVATDGGVFSFGSAEFKGSTGAIRLNAPIVSMLMAPNGAGYWLAATDGGVFTFGAVDFFGSTGHIRLNAPILDLIN